MSAREGRWWATYLVNAKTIQVEIHGEAQQVRVQTFHLPRDPSVPEGSRWRAETVITLDDVAVAAFGPTEEDALRKVREEVQKTWEARVEKQRSRPPTLSEHLTVSGPDDVFLNEPWLSVHWDRERKYVHAEFKGYANSVEFRAGTMKILEAIRAKGASAMVSDNRGLEGVTEQDQLWLNDTWMPGAVDAGVTRIAVVLAHHGSGTSASEDIIGRFGKTEFVTRIFDSVPAAVTWAAHQDR
jgi:hypothetical protein